jgi:DNA-binding transcriptional MerR regulator
VATLFAGTGLCGYGRRANSLHLLLHTNFIFTLGAKQMSIKETEALLEATRQKIADQGRMVDDRLLSKEIMLEKVLAEHEGQD